MNCVHGELQLDVTFDVIGTPCWKDIESVPSDHWRAYLKKVPGRVSTLIFHSSFWKLLFYLIQEQWISSNFYNRRPPLIYAIENTGWKCSETVVRTCVWWCHWSVTTNASIRPSTSMHSWWGPLTHLCKWLFFHFMVPKLSWWVWSLIILTQMSLNPDTHSQANSPPYILKTQCGYIWR